MFYFFFFFVFQSRKHANKVRLYYMLHPADGGCPAKKLRTDNVSPPLFLCGFLCGLLCGFLTHRTRTVLVLEQQMLRLVPVCFRLVQPGRK